VPTGTGGVTDTAVAPTDGGAYEAGGTFSSGGAPETGGAFDSGGGSTAGSSEVGGSSETGGTTNNEGATAVGGANATGGATSNPVSCDWGTPTRAGLNVASEQWSPNLSADDLTLYFSIYDGANNRIYSATRSAKGAAFGAPTHVSISGGGNPNPAQPQSPFLSRDGLTLYFVANSSSGTDKDIWTATRATTTGTFGGAQALAGVNSTKDDLRPWLSDDELTIYFASARSGGSGDVDIWTASRSARTAAFSAPTNVQSLNGTARDSSPFLSTDMLTIYFSSARTGGVGSRDIWRAKRAELQSAFGSPVVVAALDSADIDTDVTLSHDATELFFSSDTSGTALIWRAIQVCAGNSPAVRE
jgi:hypothetical protein